MATCGNCKETGQTVDHIRQCYAQARGTTVATIEVPAIAQRYVERRDYQPMALTVPDSKYSLVNIDGELEFFEVKTGKGKWSGMQFVDRLVGAPGDWRRFSVRGAAKASVMDRISLDPKEAAIRFSKHFTVCAACGSPLSDPESLALGLGPICAAKF